MAVKTINIEGYDVTLTTGRFSHIEMLVDSNKAWETITGLKYNKDALLISQNPVMQPSLELNISLIKRFSLAIDTF